MNRAWRLAPIMVAAVTVGALGLGSMSGALAQAEASPTAAVRPASTLPMLRADQMETLLRALEQAPDHGLPDALAETGQIRDQLASRDVEVRKVGYARLIAQTKRYALAMRAGRVPVSDFPEEWGLRPQPYNVDAEFTRAVQQDRVNAWLNELPPPYAGYEALQGGLHRYREIAAAGGWGAVPEGPDLKIGATGPRVAALRRRLSIEDPTVPAQGATYDAALTEGVRRAQKRYGLAPSGTVNPTTLAALNAPVERRIGQIVANLERWRWLPQRLPADRVQVNVAAAILTLFQNDTPTLSMRAATGRPNDKTPMLSSTIHGVVLNPPWNVPQGIAAKELWPKGQAYLARNGFRSIPIGDGKYRLQQASGPTSALGRFKFDFDNPYAVYLHDTPGRGVFDRYGRLVSHGCVRLEKPGQLAKVLLAGDPTWTPEAIDAQVTTTTKTVRAPLSRPVAVFLLYWTAYVGPDGQVNFRDDPYGWDRDLVRLLAAADGAAV
jgi:murein L,D-transpeptidase YcbB/YkuD